MNLLLTFLGASALLLAWWVWKAFFAHHPLDNVPGPENPSFLIGHMGIFFSNWPGRKFQTDIVDEYGRVVMLKGTLGARQIYLADPKAIRVITVREQDNFEETPGFTANNKTTLGEGLTATLGDQHRKGRKIVNPVFNVKHLRELVPVFLEISAKMADRISTELNGTGGETDILTWISRAALDLIGLGGLGYSFRALDGGHDRYVSGSKLLGFADFALVPFWPILPSLIKIGTPGFRRAVLSSIPWLPCQNIIIAVDSMWSSTVEVCSRYFTTEGNVDPKFKNIVTERNLMTVLDDAKQATNPAERMTQSEMMGQINSIIGANGATTSRALCMFIHLLSTHQEFQDRLRDEIVAAREQFGEHINYEQLESLPLLDASVRETLRLEPPIPMMGRTNNTAAVVPLMYPVKGRDGRTITELEIPAGTNVFIGILPTNTDTATWGPDAREWRPERWLAPLPQTLLEANLPGVFSHQMTFMAGNRGCIGFKFAVLEMKTIMMALLAHFRFRPSLTKHVEFVHANIFQPIADKVLDPSMPIHIEVLTRPEEKRD